MRWTWSALLLPALGAACVSDAARLPEAPPALQVEVRDGMSLSDEDVATIVELAGLVGVGPIEQVHAGFVTHPAGCLGVIVTEPRHMPDPTRVRWKQLRLAREHADCPLLSAGSGPRVTLRGWQTSPLSVFPHELRRITVGDWHADVLLSFGGQDVPYDVAVQLVTALKTGTARGDAPCSADDADRLEILDRMRGDAAPPPHDGAGHAVYALFLRGTPHSTVLTLCLEPGGVVAVSRAVASEGRV